jgi:hypothetical protein
MSLSPEGFELEGSDKEAVEGDPGWLWIGEEDSDTSIPEFWVVTVRDFHSYGHVDMLNATFAFFIHVNVRWNKVRAIFKSPDNSRSRLSFQASLFLFHPFRSFGDIKACFRRTRFYRKLYSSGN